MLAFRNSFSLENTQCLTLSETLHAFSLESDTFGGNSTFSEFIFRGSVHFRGPYKRSEIQTHFQGKAATENNVMFGLVREG